MYRFKDQFKNIFLRGLHKKKVNWFYFMPRNIKSKPFSEINVTPFVDVMLVLLIIFMVTAPLLTVGVQVDLPESNADSLQACKLSALLSGKSTWTPTVNNGAVTIKIISSTNITSTNGVTFISLKGLDLIFLGIK